MAIQPGMPALSEVIVTAIEAFSANEDFTVQTAVQARVRNKKHIEIICEKIMDHLVTNLEINGVAVTTALDAAPSGGRIIESFAGGIGSNHVPGSPADLASLTGGPVSGSVNDSKDDIGTGVQSNDGTGRVL